MGDDEAFLQAVQAAPADETLRLVYADWLDEHEDPRGQFIRLQAEIERASPHTDQYADLRTRMKALRGHIEPGWVAAMCYQPRHRPLFTTLPERRQNRWGLVEEFIEVWHRPLTPEDGYTEAELQAAERRLGVRLPAALREWYALAGRRKDVWSNQDHLESLDELGIDRDNGILIVRYVNQNFERWGIRIADLDQADPPVIGIDSGVQSSPTTSAFACLVLLYEVMWSPYVLFAVGEVTGEDIRVAAVRGLSQCDLPDCYWVDSPVRLFEGTDLIVGYHGEYWVFVAARGEEAYRQLDEEVRAQLEVYR